MFAYDQVESKLDHGREGIRAKKLGHGAAFGLAW
jgi:hypothetical protein